MRLFIYFGEGVKIAFEALKSYKLRSILTTLGIIIGVTTVITIVALIQGLNQAFSNQISALGSDVLYIDKFPWMMGGDTWWRYRNRPNLTIEDAERVKELSQMARAVAPTLYTRRTVKFQELSLDRTPVIGSTPDWVITSNTFPEYGRFLTHNDVRRRRHVAMIGTGIADQLFPNSDPLGESILIDGIKFTVVGIQEEKGKLFDNDLDAQVIIPITAFQTAFGVRYRSVHIEVKAPSPEVLEDAEIELTGVMRRVRGLKGNEENNFAINKQSMLMDTYKNLTGTLWAVAIGVGAISLLVGGIGIMNILLVSVTERTREIGIRKALGARRRDILWQFLIESMMICALGVFLGILLAVGLAKLVESTTPIPAAITLWVAFLGIGFVVTIGLVFGIYPAHKASKLNPIEALRFE
jgi:putative ABC transport system permease protein